ncbi:hypothetical protein GGS20DRAFT_596733 [Poronia punctata]|nr:hypothetical protein GGS20DRAFT_596733 [Poronia punctata]
MAPAAESSNADQVRFLIACIRHTDAGKVNFDEVYKACGIVSKGAAAKRYERLLKAYDAGPSSIKKEPKDGSDSPKAKKPRATKRKLETVDENEGDTDEPVKKEPRVKGEVKYEDDKVKLENLHDNLSRIPEAPVPHIPQSHYHSHSHSLPDNDDDDDDDDDVVFVTSITKPEKTTTTTTTDGTNGIIQLQPLPVDYDYPTNIDSTQQLDVPRPQHPRSPRTSLTMPTTTARMASPNASYPYGFTPTNWTFPACNHDYS